MKTWILFLTLLFVVSGLCSQGYNGVGIASTIYANRSKAIKEIRLDSGSVRFLTRERNISIKYDYTQMKVCSFNSEADYFRSIENEYSARKAKKKIKMWKSMQAETLEPKFEEYFNYYDTGLRGYNNETAKQPMLLVKVLNEDPHIHRESEPKRIPFLSLECTFWNSNGELMARYYMMVPGSRSPIKSHRRIACYANAGKMLSRELR